MRSSLLVLCVSLLALPRAAQAHFTILAPPPASNSTNGGKGDPPCGPTDMSSNVVTAVMGGSKLMLKVNETVSHPGFYRVALSIKSRTELPADNVVKDASGMVLLPTNKTGMSATADYQTNPVFPVLADNLFPHTSGTMFSGEITLPNVNCDKCTLQVIEFMAKHASNGDKAGFFYHHCADLKITADTSKPVFDPTAGSGAGGGSSGGAGNSAGAGGSTAGAPSGSAGASAAGAGGTGGSPSTGVSGGGAAGAGTAGAPVAIAGSASSAAGAVALAGATGTTSTGDGADSGGCAVSTHAAGSKPLLSLLLGLLVLGRRRNRRR